MFLQSPEYVRISLAGALTLRFESGRFYRNAKLYCMNILLHYPEGCRGNCAYCGLSNSRDFGFKDSTFIRVDWPVVLLNEVVERMKLYGGHIERVCVSMVTHKRAFEDTVFIVEKLRKNLDVPISVLSIPTLLSADEVAVLKGRGADRIGIAIDTATPELFERLRGRGVKGPHRWEKYESLIEESVKIFGRNKVGIHLICGLGETEREMVKTIYKFHKMGCDIHLFSFYPEKGTLLEDHPPCDEGQFRRVQLVCYLITKNFISLDAIHFDERGRICYLEIADEIIKEVILSGKPFMTSGCPGKKREVACNRPFGDGPPSDIRSYPFKPTKRDLRKILKVMNLPILDSL